MAESQSMTSAEVVAKALIEEHSDFLRESVAMIAAEIMEAEISRQIGAGKGEVAEARSTHRNGYRQRPWATRVGEIELAVPSKRSGESYFPSFLEPRKRSEKALLGVVMEAYVNGVSTQEGRPPRRRARDPYVEGPGLPHLPRARRAGRGLPHPAPGGLLPLPLARRQAPQGPRPRPRPLQGADGRLRGPRVRAARGDRHRDRRVRDRGGLGRLPARAAGPGPSRASGSASPTTTSA